MSMKTLSGNELTKHRSKKPQNGKQSGKKGEKMMDTKSSKKEI